MRNFANYDVDIHGKSSGVLKTICKKCLPTRKNKRDRSLRVNVDTGQSTSPEFPVQENPSGWTNWCCVSACGINGK